MELVWLFLGCVFVVNSTVSTVAACRLSTRTSKMLDLQLGELEREAKQDETDQCV